MKWYKQKWCRGYTLENNHAKLVGDFEFSLRKATTSRRPDFDIRRHGKENLMDL